GQLTWIETGRPGRSRRADCVRDQVVVSQPSAVCEFVRRDRLSSWGGFMALLRLATFNVENLDDGPGIEPALANRIRVMKPQLQRVNADILCLQEVHSQGAAGARTLAALDALIADTIYVPFNRATTTTTGGQLFDVRNLVILSRFPILSVQQIRPSDG